LSLNKDLHTRLIKKQSESELKRKSRKAARKGLWWTQEDIDYILCDGDDTTEENFLETIRRIQH